MLFPPSRKCNNRVRKKIAEFVDQSGSPHCADAIYTAYSFLRNFSGGILPRNRGLDLASKRIPPLPCIEPRELRTEDFVNDICLALEQGLLLAFPLVFAPGIARFAEVGDFIGKSVPFEM